MSGLSPIVMGCAIAASLLAVSIAFVLVRKARQRETFWVRPCPDCGRTVLIAYESCPACGRLLTGASEPSAKEPLRSAPRE